MLYLPEPLLTKEGMQEEAARLLTKEGEQKEPELLLIKEGMQEAVPVLTEKEKQGSTGATGHGVETGGHGGDSMVRRLIIHTLKQAWRLIVIVVGFTVLLIGLALLVLPGPAFVVIPIGLAILATEFVWARKLLRRVKREARRLASVVTGNAATDRKGDRTGSCQP